MSEQRLEVSASGHLARVRAHRVVLCAELDAVRRRTVQMREDDRARRQRMRSARSWYRKPGSPPAITEPAPYRRPEG